MTLPFQHNEIVGGASAPNPNYSYRSLPCHQSRTRFTFRRPAAHNILSILFDGSNDVDTSSLSPPRYNHGKNVDMNAVGAANCS